MTYGRLMMGAYQSTSWIDFIPVVIGGGILYSLIYKGEFIKIVRAIRARIARRRAEADKIDPPNS